MLIRTSNLTGDVDAGSSVTIGRSDATDIPVGPEDLGISREAAVIRFVGDSWVVENVGRRAFFLVEPNGEVEVSPTSEGFRRRIIHEHVWLRFAGAEADYGVVLAVPEAELPPRARAAIVDGAETGSEPIERSTVMERRVELTSTERQSILAIYDGYLQLPPKYRRQPNSFRAAAAKLSVAEGKVKADHRRVVEKVARAGGPANGLVDRDGLVGWLLTRNVISYDDVERLPVLRQESSR